MRIPQAASMARGRDDSFEQALQQAVEAAPSERVDPRHPVSEHADEVEVAEADDSPRPMTTDAPAEAPPVDEPEVDPELVAASAPPAQAADTADALHRGEPARADQAVRSAEAPRGPSHQGEPLLAAIVQRTAASQAPLPANGDGRGVAAVGGVRGGEPSARGVETPFARTSGPLRAPAAAATYRANGAASAELIEQARDSVFKQILMKLNGDGGEMRLRLEPPDLGELDLRLVVEGGNRLSLTIAAERQDLAQLLQRHLDELKQTLQQAGLEITGASVQTRSEFARDRERSDHHRDDDGAAAGEAETASTTGPRRGGYVSATGLDFWA